MPVDKTNREKFQETVQTVDVKAQELTVEEIALVTEHKLNKRKEEQNRLDNEVVFELQKKLMEQQIAQRAQQQDEKQAQQTRQEILTVGRAVAASQLSHDKHSSDSDSVKSGWAKELITAIYGKPSQQPNVIANANVQDWLTVALKDMKQLSDEFKKQVMPLMTRIVTEVCRLVLKPQLEKEGFKFEKINPPDGLFKIVRADNKPVSNMDAEKWQNAFLGEFTKRLSGLGIMPVPKPSGAKSNVEEKEAEKFSSLPNPFKTTLTRGVR